MTHTTSLSTLIFKQKSFNPGRFDGRTVWQHLNVADIMEYIKAHCSKGTLKVFRAFCQHKERYEYLYPSHAFLARSANVSIATVKRAIEKLQELGLLEKEWKSFGACHYYLHNDLFNPPLLKQLKAFFINFRIALFSALLLVPSFNTKKPSSKPNELLLILKEEDLNKNYIQERVTLTRAHATKPQKKEQNVDSYDYRSIEKQKFPKKEIPKPLPKAMPRYETLDEIFERKKQNLINRGIDVTGLMRFEILNYDKYREAEENKKIFEEQQARRRNL